MCTGPSPLARPARPDRATLSACAPLPRASSRRRPSSSRPACPRPASAPWPAAPPSAPVGLRRRWARRGNRRARFGLLGGRDGLGSHRRPRRLCSRHRRQRLAAGRRLGSDLPRCSVLPGCSGGVAAGAGGATWVERPESAQRVARCGGVRRVVRAVRPCHAAGFRRLGGFAVGRWSDLRLRRSRRHACGGAVAVLRAVRAVRSCARCAGLPRCSGGCAVAAAGATCGGAAGVGAARCGGAGGGATGCARCSPLPRGSDFPRCSGGCAAGAGGVACGGATLCAGAPGAPEIAGAAGALRSSDFPRASPGLAPGAAAGGRSGRRRLLRRRDHLDDGRRRGRCRLQFLARGVVERLARLRGQLLLLRGEADRCRRRRGAGDDGPLERRGPAACRPGRRRRARSSRSARRARQRPPARWRPFPASPAPPPCPPAATARTRSSARRRSHPAPAGWRRRHWSRSCCCSSC